MQSPKTGEFHSFSNQDELEELRKAVGEGPVFRVGELLEIKGGQFRIKSIGRKFLHLEGVPGTKIVP